MSLVHVIRRIGVEKKGCPSSLNHLPLWPPVSEGIVMAQSDYPSGRETAASLHWEIW